MPTDPAEVLRIAELAHIDLEEDEVRRYSRQLEEILDWVAMIGEVASDLTPQASPDAAADREARADLQAHPLSVGEALCNAPDPESGFFRLPRAIDPDRQD